MTDVQIQTQIGTAAVRFDRALGAFLTLVILVLVLATNSLNAGSVTLAWNPSSSSGLTNYTVKYGTASGSYTGRVDVSGVTTNATVGGLATGVNFYFVVTARSTNLMESDPSNEISYRLPTTGTNTQPTANGLTVLVREDQATAVTLTGSDPDGDPLAFQVIASPATGTLSGTAPNLTYTPSANYSGSDSFTFRVNDGLTNSANATVSINVGAVNDQPTLNALTGLTLATNPGPQTVNLTGIGSGAGNESQTLTVTATHNNPSVLGALNVAYSNPATSGTLSFTPNSGASGTAVVTVTVNDGGASNNTIVRTFNVVVGTVPATTLFLEAESGSRVSPMVVGTDANASGGQYVYSGTDEQGTVSFLLNIPQADDYYIWCRVLSEFNYTDSVYVSMDGANEDIYETALGTLSPSWQWTRLNGETLGNPRVFALSAGNHTLSFRSREADTLLDALYITSDSAFVPAGTSGNSRPTLNAISGLTINEDAGSQTVNLSGITSGSANENQTLTVIASSSNAGLIPNPSVTYTSPNATGTLAFSPVANANGSATITVTVNDGQSTNNTVTRTFTVTVGAVNDAPTLTSISSVNISEDAPQQTVALSGIASGAANENQTLTITTSSSNIGLIPNPTVTYASPNATGSLAFIPVPNASGSATISVTVNDGQSLNNTATRTFAVTVGAVNDAPSLAAISDVTITEDSAQQSIPLSGIGSGAANESQTLTITASSSNTGLIPNPTVTYTSPNATGSLAFTPIANASGSATITVTVNDGQSLNNTTIRTFTVSVTAVNDPPTLNALAPLSVNEDAGLQTVSLSGITSGAADENQSLSVTASSSNTGLIPTPVVTYTSPNTTGSLTFTPSINATGSAVITVTVNDGQSQNNTFSRTFTITVSGINDSPTIGNILDQTINENTATTALPFAISDPETTASSLALSATSSNPSVVPVSAIVFGGSGANRTVTVTPAAGQNGSSLITVTVSDGSGGTASDTFTVTVVPVNDPPTLAALSNLTISEDAGAQTVNLTGISSGATNENQTVSIAATSSNIGLIPNPTVNYISPGATGTLSFTPVANANGIATVTVTVSDGQPLNSTVTRSFTVTVSAVNDAPTIDALSNVTINEDAGTQTVTLTGIGTGAANEAQTLSVTAVSGNTTLVPNPTVTYASPNATGSLTFKPATNAHGTATITVTLGDGQSQNNTITRSFNVTVNPQNDTPTISDVANQTINEDASTAPLSFTIGDIETPATSLIITATSSNPSLVPNNNIVIGGSGAIRTVTVTPNATISGTTAITLTVDDGNGAAASDVFTLTVNPINQAPTLAPIAALTISEDAGLQIVDLSGISSGATNENQAVSIAAASSNPSLIPNPNVSYASPSTSGTLAFTPVHNGAGTATITVTVSDGQAQNSTATRTFVVTVDPVNDAPTISNIGDQSITQNGATAIIPFVVIDPETVASSLTLGVNSSNPTLVPNANISLGGSGSNRTVKVTPAANQFGSAIVTITVSDGTGGIASDSFAVTVSAGNFPPTLSPLTDLTLFEDASSQTVPLTGISSGSTNEAQNLTIVANSSNPSVIPNPTIVYSSPNATGSLLFTPVPNTHGSATISVTISDGQALNGSTTRAFDVTLNSINDPPTLNPIANVSLAANAGSETIGLAGISAGASNENDDLTITVTSSNPALIPNPTINYFSPNTTGSLLISPTANSSGTATITVTVSDGQAQNNNVVRAFTVTVTGSNNPPSISDIGDITKLVNSYPAQPSFIIGDAETSADNLTIVATSSNPTVLSTNNLVFSGTGSNRVVQLSANANQPGYSVVTLTVIDGDGAMASDSFILTILPDNQPPTLDSPAALVIAEDSGAHVVTLTGISAGSTNENQQLVITASSSNPGVVPHPQVTYTSPNTTGTLTLIPATNASGSAVIYLTVDDGQTNRNTVLRSLYVTVTPINDPPTVSAIPNQLVDQNTATAALPFIVFDAETSPSYLVLSAVSSNPTLVPNGNIALSGSAGNRSITVTPATSQSGTATITIFVSDGLLTASSSFDVTVGAGNTPPEISPVPSLLTDSYTTITNVPVVVSDKESRPEDLTLTATSYNQTVIPSTNITFSGTGTNRTMKIMPVAGKSGDVSVSLALSDGRALTRCSFQVTVQAGSAPKSRISVKKKGAGSVQPNLDGLELPIGETYTLTAIPSAGEVFVGWSGSITSSSSKVTFVMNTNVSLEASFTNSPYVAMKGTYNGLFHEAAEIHAATAGSFSVAASERGSYSGKLKLGAKTYSLRGLLGLNGKATNSITRKGLNTLTVEIAFGGDEQVAGRVTDGIWEAPLLGDRAVFNSKTNPAPYLGAYTLIVPGQDSSDLGPEGDGAASVKVDGNGLATLAGTLADGTKLSQRVALSRQGHWPLHVPLYSGAGGVVSWLVVTNRASDDINGLLSWIKPTVLKSRQYPGGFTNETVALGSAYVRPATSTNRVLSLTDLHVAFGGGNLAAPFSNTVTLGDGNRFTNQSTNKLALSVSTSSGLFAGTVQDPSSNKTFKFKGALFQRQNAGAGYLLGTNSSARVVLSE